MRFEELAYTVDGLPVTVNFAAGLTVVPVPTGERAAWIARLFGVLEGFRAGDGAAVVWVDHTGRRRRLERDPHGAARLSDPESGTELRYSAAHLSLDGRYDWFASIGITGRAAAELMVVDREVFSGDDDVDRTAVEAELAATRTLLARAQRQLRAATARCLQAESLRRRIADLDDLIHAEETALAGRRQVDAARVVADLEAELSAVMAGGPPEIAALLPAVAAADAWRAAVEQVDDVRRTVGSRPRLDADRLAEALARPAEVPADLHSRAAACRALAQRRDELLLRLRTSQSEEADADVVRQLTEEVEPAFVDALAALAGAARPFNVMLDSADLERAGCDSDGIARLAADVLAEVASRAGEAADARRQQALDDAEASCREARQALVGRLAEVGLPSDETGDLAVRLEALAARAAASSEPGPAPDPRPVTAVEADLDQARAVLAELQQDPEGSLLVGGGSDATATDRARLMVELEQLEWDLPDLDHLAGRQSDLQRQVVALDAVLRTGRRHPSVEAIEAALLGRAEQIRRRREPLPLVVDTTLDPFDAEDKRSLLAAVARIAETTQVLYLTDDPDALAWASDHSEAHQIAPSPLDGIATVA